MSTYEVKVVRTWVWWWEVEAESSDAARAIVQAELDETETVLDNGTLLDEGIEYVGLVPEIVS